MGSALRTCLSTILLCAVAACGGSVAPPASSGFVPGADAARATGASPIKHVVIVIQENRSFDNFFATYPGADGATHGLCKYHGTTKTFSVALQKKPLLATQAAGYAYGNFLGDSDGGKMDGFCGKKTSHSFVPYQYVDPQQIQPYWAIANQYVLADRMFQTMGTGSFEAHQDLIRGDTALNASESVVDNPNQTPWGCDSPVGTVTNLLESTGQVLPAKGPYPCYTWTTLRDLLDKKGVSWRYYSPITMAPGSNGGIWNAFLAIRQVYSGPEWKTNVTNAYPYEKQIFTDITKGQLPAVSWVIPDAYNSDHEGVKYDYGPGWVSSVVNAVGQSKYWDSTAIVIVWDDWGGWYDHVPPLKLNYYSSGFRVPCLIVSPYARKGYVDHTQYAFGSILRYVEDTFSLGRLGTTDTISNSIRDAFDYGQAPRAFTPIPAAQSKSFFVHQAPSMLPVDTQ